MSGVCCCCADLIDFLASLPPDFSQYAAPSLRLTFPSDCSWADMIFMLSFQVRAISDAARGVCGARSLGGRTLGRRGRPGQPGHVMSGL